MGDTHCIVPFSLDPALATRQVYLFWHDLSVCLCVSLSRVNRQTYGPEFWPEGQVEGYLGQVRRSRSLGQKTLFQWDVMLWYSSNQEATDVDKAWLSAFCSDHAISSKLVIQAAGSLSMWNSISYTNFGVTTWGVFKAYAVFLNIKNREGSKYVQIVVEPMALDDISCKMLLLFLDLPSDSRTSQMLLLYFYHYSCLIFKVIF